VYLVVFASVTVAAVFADNEPVSVPLIRRRRPAFLALAPVALVARWVKLRWASIQATFQAEDPSKVQRVQVRPSHA